MLYTFETTKPKRFTLPKVIAFVVLVTGLMLAFAIPRVQYRLFRSVTCHRSKIFRISRVQKPVGLLSFLATVYGTSEGAMMEFKTRSARRSVLQSPSMPSTTASLNSEMSCSGAPGLARYRRIDPDSFQQPTSIKEAWSFEGSWLP